jgi:hypothetical protein
VVNYNIKRAPSLLSSDVVYYSNGLFPGNENGRFINKYLKHLPATDYVNNPQYTIRDEVPGKHTWSNKPAEKTMYKDRL